MSGIDPKMTVYTDPAFPKDKILMGYKGKSSISSGFVHAPYEDPEPPLPSVVDKLAATVDDEAAARVQEQLDAHDEWAKRHDYRIQTIDFVADPSVPKAVPLQ